MFITDPLKFILDQNYTELYEISVEHNTVMQVNNDLYKKNPASIHHDLQWYLTTLSSHHKVMKYQNVQLVVSSSPLRQFYLNH